MSACKHFYMEDSKSAACATRVIKPVSNSVENCHLRWEKELQSSLRTELSVWRDESWVEKRTNFMN